MSTRDSIKREVRVLGVDPQFARPWPDDSLDLAVENQGLDAAVGRLG